MLLLQKLVDGKLWDEAKRVGESAIFVDVESPLMHTNYARALAATGGHDKAAFELESALAAATPSRRTRRRRPCARSRENS